MHRHRYRTRSGQEKLVWREKLKIGGKLRYITAPTRGDLRIRILAAQQKAAEATQQEGAGALLPDLIRAWRTATEGKMHPQTWRRYKAVVPILCELLAGKTAGALKPTDVDQVLEKIQAKRGQATAAISRNALSRVFRPLRKAGVVLGDPVGLSEPVPQKKRAPTVWTAAEALRWMQFLEDRQDSEEALYALLILHGIREAEALSCRLDGLRLDEGRLTYTPKKKKDPQPRDLTLVQHSRDALRRWLLQRRQLPALSGIRWQERGWLFCTATGGPKHPRSLLRRFRKLTDGLGLSRVRIHDQRHLHATLALEKGVPAKFVQEALAHSSYSITMDTYSHVRQDQIPASALAVELAIWGQSTG